MGEAKIKQENIETGLKKACGNCKNYVMDPTNMNQGNCTRYPPHMTMVVVPGGGVAKFTGYPEVKQVGVPCGEHVPVFTLS